VATPFAVDGGIGGTPEPALALLWCNSLKHSKWRITTL
jgi:hypothetical protein